MQSETLEKKPTLSFLQGGGEMGERTRNYNWSQTSVGTPDQWPQSLRTTLGILLHSAFPMFLFWGEELICFYNDAFRPSLGEEGKHPALGKGGKEVWPEIWEFIGPLIEKVMTTGEPVFYENQLVPFYRNGKIEDIYWTFSYSPAYSDNGEINGVFVTCTETTNTITAFQQLQESKQDVAFALEAAELATWDFSPITNQFTADARYTEWFGLTAKQATNNNLAINIIADEDRERVKAALAQSLIYASGGTFDIEYTIHPRNKPERTLRAKGKAWFNKEKVAYRLTGTLQDVTGQVTARKKIEESELRFRRLIEQSPVAMALFTGREMKIEVANEPMIAMSGKDASIIGKPIVEAMPELVGQPFLQILDDVFTSGKPYEGKAAEVRVLVSGKPVTSYLDFSYTPVLNAVGEVYGIMDVSVDVTGEVLAQKKLEESEKSLRNLILQAPVAMCIFRGPDYVVEIVNERMLESWDKTEKEVLNKPVYKALPEARGQGYEDLLDKVYSTGKTITAFGAPATLTRSGVKETRYVNLVYDALRDGDGTISGIMVVNTDVTEQVMAGKKIEKSREELQMAIEIAELGTFVVDLKAYTGTYTKRVMEWFGFQEGQMGMDTIFAAIHPEDQLRVTTAIRQSIVSEENSSHDITYRVLHPVDGSEQHFRSIGKAFFNAEGIAYEIRGVIQDVTSLTQHHRKLEESEQNLRNIILTAPVAMNIFKGPSFMVELANERMFEVWGTRGEKILGKPVFEALPEAKGFGFEELLDQVYKTGETVSADERPILLPRNGKIEEVYINVVYAPFREINETISGIIAVAVDVTGQVISRKKAEESEQEVRAVVESAPFPIGVYVGREFRIRFVNQSIIDVWGKGPDLVGKLYMEALPELKEQNILPQLYGVYDTGVPFHARNQRVDLFVDGQLRPYWFNYSFTPLFDAQGKVYGIMNTAADVTDLNLAHQKIEESESRFRNMVEQAPVAIAVFAGKDFVAEIANEAYLPLAGKTREEFIGNPLFESLPEARKVLEPIINNIIETGQPFYASEFGIVLNRYGTDEQCYFNLAYEPLKEADGRINGLMVVAHEVTGQVMARKKIEEAEERARLAIDSAELGTYEINLLSNELFASARMADIFDVGTTADRNRYIAAIHPEDLKVRDGAYKKAIETGNLDYDGRVVKKDGSIHWVRVKGKMYYNEEKTPVRLLGVVQDITEQKEFEARLNRLVEERTAELGNINNELKRSNANLEEFAYAASHDMKEPIRKIHFFTDRLKTGLQDQLNEENQRYFERLETGAKRMGTLIDDLLLYSHISRGAAIEESVDLNQIITLVKEDMELAIEEKHAVIIVESLPKIKGHRRQLQQLFENLIGNALKYSKPGVAPQLWIKSVRTTGNDISLSLTGNESDKHYYQIEVRDNGIGFDQADAERIFNVFTRLHGNTEYKGTGVGLSIVRKVAENHGGYAWAESKEGEGATFKVLLPAHNP